MDIDSSPFLDREREIEVREGGNLPHWHQKNVIQFVTFRLADSLPKERISDLNDAIGSFKNLNPEPWNLATQRRFRRIISRKVESMLDRGYGDCILADARVRRIVAESIWFRDGEDYEVMAYVIMPNHIHLLIRVIGNVKLSQIVGSIKSYTSHIINKTLGRKGENVWMRESYDHIVRNEDELKHFRNYIHQNPKYLQRGMYEVYVKGWYNPIT